jgi:hypothetical protein
LPAGFTITSGAGTNNITVSVGIGATIGNNQNITVQAFNPCGNNGSKTDKINVNTFNGVTVNQSSQNVCSNGSITVIGTLTGNAASGTWSAPSGSFSNIVTSGTNPVTVSATYTPSISSGNATLKITTNAPSGGGCPNVPGTANVDVTVNEAITITSQPTATQTACSGTNASFSVTATGTGITYQWRKGITNLVNGGNISGATSATLTLTGVSTTDAGSYNVVVSGTSPCAAVTSNPATLAVNQVVAISTQPAANQTICTGNSVSFNTTATGTGLTYQWRKGTTNLTNTGSISGTTSNTLTINPTTLADAASDYNVVITGTAPCTAAISNNAALVVNDAVAITSQPAATQTVCSGMNASFSVTATGTGLTYQWKKGATNLVNGGNISGATSATLTLTGVSTTDAGSYNVVVSAASPCAAVTSSSAVLVVNQVVAISAQPALSQTACTGNSVSFNVTASGTGLTYQWRKGTTNLSNVGNIIGTTTNTLTINPVASGDTATDYNVVITGTAPCSVLTSNNSALVVNEAITITSQPLANQTICSGTNTSFSVTATGTGLTYQWRKGTTNLVNGGNISGATTATLTLTGVLTSDAGSYNVVVSGASPCTAATSSSAVLVVNQIVAISTQPTLSQTVCSGNSASFSVTANGTGLSYQWRKGTANLSNVGNISGATSNILTINPVASGDAATDYNVVITGTAPCSALTSTNSALVVNEAITINSQPTANQTACSGTNTSFSVTATGTGITYQWRKGTTNLVNGGNIGGATSATLTLTGVSTTDAGSYNVVVSGASPCAAVTSSSAVLVVNQVVAISAQPALSQTTCTGNSVSFNVTASGTGLTYQWRKGTTNLSNVGNISGTTTNILTINPVASTDAASDYNVVITGTAPCTVVASNNSALVVNDAVVITSQPAATQTACSGTNASFSVTATGTGLTYQWRKGTTNLLNGGNINGATSANLTISNVASADAANNYNVIITGTSPCTPVISDNAILLVNKKVVIGTQPSNVGICASSPAQFGVVASGDGLTYQWYKGTFPGTAVTNTAFITGAQTSILNFSQAFLSDDGIYFVVISGASPCASVKSTEVTLNVDQSILITSQPISQSICIGSNATFTVAANANGDPLTYQWRKNGSNIIGQTSTSLTINNSIAGDTGNYDVVISGPVGYTCSSVTSTVAVLTVNPLPIISGGLSVCPSYTTQLTGSGSAAAVSPWVSANTAVATVSNTGLVTGVSTGSNIITYTNNNGCKTTAVVTVTPSAQVNQPTSQVICNGSATALIPFGTINSGGTTTYSWTNSATSIGLAATGTGDIPSFVAINNGISPIIATIVVTPTYTNGSANCTGPTKSFTITVNPSAQVNQPTSQVICNGSSTTLVTFATANSGGATTYSWTNNNASIGLASSGTGNIPIFTAVNSGTTPIVATIIVTPNFNNGSTDCSGPTKTFTITVNPTAQVNPVSSQVICNGSTTSLVTFATTNTGGTTTYSWTNNNASIGLAASGTGNIPAFTAANSGTTPIVATIIVTPNFNNGSVNCTGSTQTFTITVNPTAQVNPIGSQVICNGSTTSLVTFATANSGGTTTYSWTNNTASIGLAASGTGNILAFTATNAGSSPVTATITATPTFNNGSVNCSGATKTFTITVNPTAQVNQPTNQVFCNGSSTTSVVFGTTNTVGTTTYSWTNDNISIGLASSGTGNIPVFTATNAGSSAVFATIVVTPTYTNGGTSCTGPTKTFTLKVDAASVGGAVTFSMPNITPVVTTFTDCHSASGTIYLSGHNGTITRWESSINAGSTWTTIGNAGNVTYNYSNVAVATMYRAVIQNASCITVNSVPAILFIIPNIKPSPVSATPSTICEGDSTTLFSSSSFSSSQNLLNGGLFETAQPEGWYVDGGNFNASGDNGKVHTWLETNGNAGTEYDTTSNDKFAIVRGAVDSRLETPIFDLIGLTTASLTFDYAYQLTAGAWGTVELSFDGGANYPVTLATYTGNQTPLNKFNTPMSIPLNAYLGYSNLRIKFNFHGTVNSNDSAFGGSSWAIDNVKIPQAPIPNITSDWEDLNSHTIISVSNTTNINVSPAITTTYAVTSYLNGCRSYGPDGTTYVTVTVNKRPTANIGVNQLICYGGTANFTIALTGKAPWIVTYSSGTTSTTVTTSNNPYTFSINNITANATYTVTNLSDANCTAALPSGLTGSATVTVLTGTAGVWTGLVSTDWFDCKNWEQGLPSLTIDAQIPTNPNNTGIPKRMPVIDRTSPYASLYNFIASARDLIVSPGASVTMVNTNNSELQISRDWKNSGTFTPGTGTVTFNGYTANQIQNINLGIKTNETFYNLTTNNLNGAKGISLVNTFELTVLNTVTLTSGDIRLTGEAQLVQAGTTANPATGTGKLLRDQQGQRNSFNYNYWSSPVSSGSNASYSVGSVINDGTDVITNPFGTTAIAFDDGAFYADTALSIPIKTSNRWIWSYNSLTPDSNTSWDDYYQWNYIGSTGLIKTGEGFTMKGTGGTAAINVTQNYVFAGKPNSGNIALNIVPQGTYLVGNPYPSALDANEFILDNLAGRAGVNVFNGALYFWDHFGLTDNHYLAEYVGGYAVYTLTGGVKAIANDPLNVNNNATGSKTPGRYIPVAQGFFVDAALDSDLTGTATTIQGGTINFKNSQRAFVREGSASSVFMKKRTTSKTNADTRPKIRLGFDSSIGAHRQLLVGADPNTTNQFDIGYDAQMFDTNENDMYWEIGDNQFVIQAIPDFNTDRIIPLGLVIANEGEVTIKIDELENVSSNTKIYLYDNKTGMYHDLKNSDFKIALAVGTYNKRFSLKFESQALNIDEADKNDGILVLYSRNYKTLIIKNNDLDSTVKTVALYNMLGQAISNWDVEDKEQTNIQIPIKNMPSGIYIVKVKTSKGESSKKIIIN